VIYYLNMDKKIQDIITKLNKVANKDIAFAGQKKVVEGQSTGVEMLDFDIGCNGYPKGRITEIYGIQSSAKTSLALWGIASAQREGKTCVFVDAEYALDLQLASSLGVDVENLIVLYPDNGEEAFSVIENLLRDKTADLIVVDSVPSLVPTPELEAEVNKPTMGGQARLIAAGLRRLVPLVSKQNAVLILINQVRANIMGGIYDPYVTPGGYALKFYTSLRIELKNKGKLVKGEETVGQQVIYRMKKNKVGMNNDSGLINYVYNDGFYAELNLLAMGVKKGVITRGGNTYSWGEQKLGVSKAKAEEFLETNPEIAEQIRKMIDA